MLAVALALLVQGCAKEDGSRIFGHWRAERFEVAGLKLPVGPELHIAPHMLSSAGGDLQLPITGMSEEDDEVTLDTEASIGITFHFVESDRMYVELPFMDRIYYRRVPAGAASVAAPAPARAGAVAVAAPAAQVTPAVPQAAAPAALPASETPDLSAPGVAAYDAALSAARAGDDDQAVRHLYQAYHDGLRDSARIASAPEFGRLRSDVRFQVLLARFKGA